MKTPPRRKKTRKFEDVKITYANGFSVRLTSKGVTIREPGEGRWIVDASCIAEDGVVRVSIMNTISIGEVLPKKGGARG